MLFSGRSHPALASGSPRSSASSSARSSSKTFANGEAYCRYLESIRGADVFIVQTGCAPVDKHLMELLLMIQAAKLALGEADHRRDPAGSPTRARTASRRRASRSPRAWSPTCSSSRAPTAC